MGSSPKAVPHEQTQQMFRQYAATGDPGLRERLIAAHSGLVTFLAAKFANRGEPLEDLISVANIGLIKAVDRFDPGRGLRFSTFATPTIVGEIRRHFRDRAWSLKVPRRLKELNQSASKASARLAQKLGRPPGVQDIAREINASEEDTLAALELANAYDTVSVDAPYDGHAEALPAPAESLGGEDEQIGRLELYDDLNRALERLEGREREILTYRYIHGMSQTEVAKRLNISQMHVSRLQTKALKTLRRMLEQ
jgi:RNA polymerase sigma-B factor